MLPVLHFRKELADPPVASDVLSVVIRPITVPEDVEAWLRLRERATAELSPPVRAWTERDFFAEIIRASWHGKGGTWVAVNAGALHDIVGTVTLAIREGASGEMAVVHWLLVDPDWRHRGVARMLMLQLERAAWEAGWREVQLERTQVGPTQSRFISPSDTRRLFASARRVEISP